MDIQVTLSYNWVKFKTSSYHILLNIFCRAGRQHELIFVISTDALWAMQVDAPI